LQYNFPEAGYFEISTISSSLSGQTLYAFTWLYKFQAWQMTTVTAIHCVRKDVLYK